MLITPIPGSIRRIPSGAVDKVLLLNCSTSRNKKGRDETEQQRKRRRRRKESKENQSFMGTTKKRVRQGNERVKVVVTFCSC